MLSDAEIAAAWGESIGQSARAEFSNGEWSWALTPDGIVDLAFAGRVLSPLITFSIRDLLWGTPSLPFVARDDLAFEAECGTYPLVVTGSVEPGDDALTVRFRVTATGPATVARCAPLVLHAPEALAPSFEATFPSGPRAIDAPARVDVARVTTGYTGLAFEVGGMRASVDFTQGVFEMEDQRNWGDATFKSYTPPLGGPVLGFDTGETRDFELRIRVTGRPAPELHAPPRGRDLGTHPMPELGLAHRSGRLSEAAAARLAGLGIGYLHLLVDLSADDWRSQLESDISAATQLGADAVLSVDVAPDQHPLLGELATLAAGRVSTAYVFDFALPCTSDELAAAASLAFAGTGIAVGGGTRAYFADLSKINGVPTPVDDVAVAIAVASHASDREALVGSLDSLVPTVDSLRQLAPGRPVLIGPLGFRATFDSWGPIETLHDLAADWLAPHPRDGSEFAAAWLVGAVAELTTAGVSRITIAATVGGRGVLVERDGRVEERPTATALRALSQYRGGDVAISRPRDDEFCLNAATGTTTASFHGELPTFTSEPTER